MSFYVVTLDLTRSPPADYQRVNETMEGLGFRKGNLPNTTFIGSKSRSEFFDTPKKFSEVLRAVFAAEGIKVAKVLVCETDDLDLWVRPADDLRWLDDLLNPIGGGLGGLGG